MSRRLLIDGDSLAKSPTSNRLSITRLDSAITFLRRETEGAGLRMTLIVSHAFGAAMTGAQRARLDRIVPGTFQFLPDGVHLRDFIVRGADDGSAIVVSNNAFTRQREGFPWLMEAGNGRHVLARRADEQSEWQFVEARPLGGSRRTLGQIVGGRRPPVVPPTPKPPKDETASDAAQPEEDKGSDPAPAEQVEPTSPTGSDGAAAGRDDSPVDDHIPDRAPAASTPSPTESSTDPVSTQTGADLCAAFGVDGDYVLALINRGQGPEVSDLDEMLPERTIQRVTRLLTDDINRYPRKITDIPKVRNVDIEEVRRRARNSHVPLALRPGGDRTTSAGYAKILERFSEPSQQRPLTQSVTEMAAQFEVDIDYVVAIARMHTKDPVSAGSTLTKGLAGIVRQTLEFDLFPFTRRLQTAADHLGSDLQTLRALAEELGITTAERPDGPRLSAGDYQRLVTAMWATRSETLDGSAPSGAAAPGSGSTPSGSSSKRSGASTSASGYPSASKSEQSSTTSATSPSESDAGKPGIWGRLRGSRSKKQ